MIDPSLDAGFQIHRDVFSTEELAELRLECDALATQSGSACVRHVRAKSPRLRELSQDQKLRALIPAGHEVVRSILFDKTPAENWPVAWHQDLTIAVTEQVDLPDYSPWSIKEGSAHVQPPRQLLENMLTLRIHLDDTPASNGALRVIPHSHKNGRVDRPPSSEDEVICECAAGDVLAMSPLILHASSRSERPARRRIIHFEYTAPDVLHPALKWSEPR